MFQICCKDMPEGFDPSNKNQFNKAWIHRFMGHEDLSVRLRTNKKKKSVFERMHKIHGFHWYAQYQMAFADISSEEEESSSSEDEESSEDVEEEDETSSSSESSSSSTETSS